MEEKKIYTEEEIEQLAEKASQNAMEHFKHGLNCGECVLQGFLDLGISEYPPEIIALVSGMGGGMGFTKHTCGAVNAGMVVIGSKQGRKNARTPMPKRPSRNGLMNCITTRPASIPATPFM